MIKIPRLLIKVFIVLFIFTFLNFCTSGQKEKGRKLESKAANLYIGWSSESITPDKPVMLQGQFYARISEGIMDPVTATALALEYKKGMSSEHVIMISCDLISISDNMRDSVRNRINRSLPELLPEQIILNATHTHSGPQYSGGRKGVKDDSVNSKASDIKNAYGVEFDAMEFSECLEFLSARIVKLAMEAWIKRKPGGMSYGLGHAVVGQNRLVAYSSGKSMMYGAPHTNREEFGNTNKPDFSHIEGYEDHSVNLLYTWDKNKKLTGVVINIAATSQVSMHSNLISADYWHDTREEVRQRLGKDVYILPQCSAAGDQDTYIMVGAKAEERMQRLMFSDSIKTGNESIGRRKQIARHIADAVTSVLPYMNDNIEWNPEFVHRMDRVELSRRFISQEDVNNSLKEGVEWENNYKRLLTELKTKPGVKENQKLYIDLTYAYRSMMRGYSVKDRYELEKAQSRLPIEVHVIRIGDVVIATSPFELYLDYGIRIKARSPATQTFLVQLCGSGSYIPTARSISGGGYGAVPASTLVGPEGGQELVEKTLELINSVWEMK
jgi:hypothetical protein